MMTFKLKNVLVEVTKVRGKTFNLSSTNPLIPSQLITKDVLEKYFEPVNCEALNFVDPDRVKRISDE